MNFDTIIENYMPIAKSLSVAMQRQKKHTSIIIHKKKIVAIGQNVFKTHPKTIKLGYKYGEMHSELDAFRKVPYNLRDKKLILLNVRFNRFGEFRNSKPCAVCSKWCSELFHKIYYTTDDGLNIL